MLDFPTVRAAFVTNLLWGRYGPFWRGLLQDAGAEPLFPTADAVRAGLDDPRVAAVPSVPFGLACAQALAAHDADVLVVPDLNAGSAVERGGGQDPWIADFPGALARALAGLPPLLAVPADLGPGIEGVAVRALQGLLRDPARVERLWARHRSAARPVRYAAPRWTLLPSETATVGVIGQPWLIAALDAGRLRSEGEHLVTQAQVDPRALRDEATRADARFVPTDAEAIGAARLFGRRSGVDRLRFVADRTSGSDGWLLTQVQKVTRKVVDVVYLQDLLGAEGPVDALSATPVD